MTMSANLHGLKSVKAFESGPHAWLSLKTRDGCDVAVRVGDYRLAEMMADAFAEYHDWLSGQECPTYDDARGAGQVAVQDKKPTKRPGEKRLTLALDGETYKRLRLHAAEADQTHQAILEAALSEYLGRKSRRYASTRNMK